MKAARLRQQLFQLACALLLALLVPAPAAAQGPEQPAALVVAAGERIDGDLATAAQPIEVYGEVLGDVTSLSGNIHIAGRVGGDVISYGGLVVLDAGARVDGHVLSVASAVLRAEGAQVAGRLMQGNLRDGAAADLLGLLAPPLGGDTNPGPLARSVFSFALVLALLALSTMGALIWPRRAAGAGSVFTAAPWRSLGLGALTTLLLGALLLPLGALLGLTLLGLPLLPPLLLLLHLPYALGLAALGQLLGRRLTAAPIQHAAPLGVLLLLVPPALLGALAPAWGLALFYLVAGAGLGALIISRGGTLVR
jgi:cytoskeletal protein CcmA (bactofilin family)